MADLASHLAAWKPFSAVVVGDYMLDETIFGDAERLSPDAPVPVLKVRNRTHNPGGAASLCLDLAHLHGNVHAIGVRGNDAAGALLADALAEAGVKARGVVTDPTRCTTRKQSLVGLAQHRHPQKMFRLDEESNTPVSGEVIEQMLAALEQLLPTADVVCIEDYDKGVCTTSMCAEVIRRSRDAGVPVYVDPARIEDYTKYTGCTAITPNRTEAEDATGLSCAGEGAEANEPLARALLELLQSQAVVLTLDRHGALLLEAQGMAQHVPTLARTVYDVTGAGDMFLAGLAAARANGLSWADATRFANAAAGLAVEVFGVQPIPLERVVHAVLEAEGLLKGKTRTWEQARVEIAARRRQGQRIVFTNGCFDVLHSGHVSLLERAAEQGDFLIVGLNDDGSVRRLKGEGRPMNPENDRARVLGALEAVGAVVLFGEDTPLELIRLLRPDVLVKGADYRREEVVGVAEVESWGGRIVLVDLVEGKSTSATLERMRSARA